MFSLEEITGKRGKRVLITGQGGLGKSTGVGKVASKPLLLNLDDRWPEEVSKGVLIPKMDYTWENVEAFIDEQLKADKVPYKSLIIDTATKLIEKMEAHIIVKDFQGDRGKYVAYGAGLKVLKPLVAQFKDKLDSLQKKHDLDLFIIAHTKSKSTKNPISGDYDKFFLDLPETIEAMFFQWADYVGFVFDDLTIADKKVVANQRTITFQDSPLYQAKFSGVVACPEKIPFDRDGRWYQYVSGEISEVIKELNEMINSLPADKREAMERTVVASDLRNKPDHVIRNFIEAGKAQGFGKKGTK